MLSHRLRGHSAGRSAAPPPPPPPSQVFTWSSHPSAFISHCRVAIDPRSRLATPFDTVDTVTFQSLKLTLDSSSGSVLSAEGQRTSVGGWAGSPRQTTTSLTPSLSDPLTIGLQGTSRHQTQNSYSNTIIPQRNAETSEDVVREEGNQQQFKASSLSSDMESHF